MDVSVGLSVCTKLQVVLAQGFFEGVHDLRSIFLRKNIGQTDINSMVGSHFDGSASVGFHHRAKFE